MSSWDQKNLQEKKETFAKHVGYELVQSIIDERAPFLESRDFSTSENRAFNPTNGIAYNNLNSLMLDIKQKQGNYQKNQWISLNDARFLGASDEEIKEIYENAQRKDNPNGIVRAQISYIKTSELQYVKKLDENGNFIPLLDEDGKQKVSSKGELLFENEKVPQLDANNNVKYKENGEPFMDFKTQRVEIAPTLVVESLFNIDEFKTIDKKRLKELNPKTEFRHITKHKDGFDPSNSNLILEDLKGIVYPETIKTIANYLYTQNAKGHYTPSVKKEQAQEAQIAIKEAGKIKERETKQEKQQEGLGLENLGSTNTSINTNANKSNKKGNKR